MERSFLGVIPARAGSKRISNKNFRPFAGSSLVERAIDCANESRYISGAILATDDEKILRHKFDARIKKIKRPNYLSADESLVIDLLKWLNNKGELQNFDYVVLLQPTSPFREAIHVDLAIDYMLNSHSESLVSVSRLHQPQEWIFPDNGDKHLSISKEFEEAITKRSQDLTSILAFNGAIYIIPVRSIESAKSHIQDGSVLFEMDDFSSIDIDYEYQFKFAEVVARSFKS